MAKIANPLVIIKQGGGAITAGTARITTAELPPTTFALSFKGSIVQTKATDSTKGGKVSFDVDETGNYTVIALRYNTEIWSKMVVVDNIGEYIVKSGKSLADYTLAEMHTALQGGYFSTMFSLRDTFTLSLVGTILHGSKFFVENITQTLDGKEIVDFRMTNQYAGSLYEINPPIAYLPNESATAWVIGNSTKGGYKYSALRQKMLEKGEVVYSQATGIKPDNSSLTSGIPFSRLKYTDTNEKAEIYNYDTSTDTFTPLTAWRGTNPSFESVYFVKGYFSAVGRIGESPFNGGSWYTYDPELYLYTPATTYSSTTTYYGFFEKLQNAGLFVYPFLLTSIKGMLARFDEKASSGGLAAPALSTFSDYCDIPAIEEVTGVNRETIIMSGAYGLTINANNIAGEGVRKPAYTEFSVQATGLTHWSRSAHYSDSVSFCSIANTGQIATGTVSITRGVRLGFRLK